MPRGRRWLVTGAGGFVGRRLASDIVARGERVCALLRAPCAGPWDEHVICDLGRDLIPARVLTDIAGIFHLAGIAHTAATRTVPDEDYWRVNVDGTRSLVAAAAAAGVDRLIYFSSVKAAADPGEHCVDETWDAPPSDAYGRSKRAAEAVVRDAHCRLGMHAVVLRPTLVYGPGVKGNLARMLTAVARGRFPPLADCGNRRSMVSVSDLSAVAWQSAQQPAAAGKCYLVADGVDYSTRSIYEAMCRALGKEPARWVLPVSALTVGAYLGDMLQPLLCRRLPLNRAIAKRLTGSACYRAHRLMDDLDWLPKQDLDAALPALVAAARHARQL